MDTAKLDKARALVEYADSDQREWDKTTVYMQLRSWRHKDRICCCDFAAAFKMTLCPICLGPAKTKNPIKRRSKPF